MLLKSFQDLRGTLVLLLADCPGSTALQLHERLGRRGRIYTLRAVYKELRFLEEQRVVVKTKKTFGLQLIWLINMTVLLNRAYRSYLTQTNVSELVPFSGKSELNKFPDLDRLDHFWMQVIVILQRFYKDEPMFVSKPHQWFHLSHEDLVDNYFDALNVLQVKQYHLIGRDCYVCRFGARKIPTESAIVLFSARAFISGMNVYYTLIGKHLLTVRLEAGFAQRMDELFCRIENLEQMKAQHVKEFMRRKVQSTLKIEYGTPKVARIRSLLEDIFGENRSGRLS
jgi:hypothetical protein